MLLLDQRVLSPVAAGIVGVLGAVADGTKGPRGAVDRCLARISGADSPIWLETAGLHPHHSPGSIPEHRAQGLLCSGPSPLPPRERSSVVLPEVPT